MSGNRQIARNTFYLYLRMIVVMCITLYTTRILLEAIGVEDYGIYSVVCGFVSMLGFLNTSITNAIQRYYNYELGKGQVDNVQRIFTSALIIQILLSVIIVLIAETVGLYYLENKLVIPESQIDAAKSIFHLSVITMCISLFQTPFSAAVMAFEKMNFYAIVSIVDAVLKLIVVILLKYCPNDRLLYYGLLLVAVAIIDLGLYVAFVKSKIQVIKLSFPISRNMLRSILSFSSWNIFSSVSNIVSGQGVNILLNIYFSPIVNASRGVANQIMSAVQYFSANIIVAFRPQLIQEYSAGNYMRTNFLLFSMSKVAFLLMLVIAMPVVIEINQILRLWLGDNIPEYTSTFSSLVIISMLINILNSPISVLAHATGNIRRYELFYGIITASVLPISYVFLEFGFNPEVVYIINILIVILNQIICVANLKRLYPLNLRAYIRGVIVPCVVMSLTVPIIPILFRIFMDESFIRLLSVSILSVLIAVLEFYLFLNKGEKDFIRNFLKKLIK